MSIFEYLSFSVDYLINRKNKLWAKLCLISSTIFLASLLLTTFVNLLKNNKAQLTTYAFMNIETGSENVPEEKFKKSTSFENLVVALKEVNQENKFIEYYYSSEDRSWHDQALFYSLNSYGLDIHKDSYEILHKPNSIIVWEKEPDDREPYWKENFKVLYFNEHYLVATADSQ